MKTRSTIFKAQALEALNTYLNLVPFLENASREFVECPVPPAPGFLVVVRAPDSAYQLGVETLTDGQPRKVRAAIQRFWEYKKLMPEAYQVIIAPYISPESAQLCRDYNVGYIDLSGNARLLSLIHI